MVGCYRSNVRTIGEKQSMIDYSEMKLNIQRLNEQFYSYMNARNYEKAQEVAVKLEMAAMMAKKFVDYVVNIK